MRKIFLATSVAAALLSPAQGAEKKAKTPEQACQTQALTSIAREWPNVFKGEFEIILKGNRCLVFLQAPSAFEGKRSDRGLCSYRGGKFPTAECTFGEYMDKAHQM